MSDWFWTKQTGSASRSERVKCQGAGKYLQSHLLSLVHLIIGETVVDFLFVFLRACVVGWSVGLVVFFVLLCFCFCLLVGLGVGFFGLFLLWGFVLF